MEQLLQYDDEEHVYILNLDGDMMELANISPFFNTDYDNHRREVITCYSTMEEED